MADADIAWALAQYQDSTRSTMYRIARDYYRGDQRLMFATDKFKSTFATMLRSMSDNLCPAVVDSLTDRLELQGFDRNPRESVAVSKQAWDVWQRNGMDMRSSEVHREALLCGDSYVIVWPGPDGQATIWPQKADEMAVEYSTDIPGLIVRASKMWVDKDGYVRLTIYLPDGIERYRSRSRPRNLSASSLKPQQFLPFPPMPSNAAGQVALEALPNPYDQVPVFHFPNRSVHEPGFSELLDVVPLQDILNKSVADMLVASEFASFRQRWVTGLEIQIAEDGKPIIPFRHGADQVWASSDPQTRFGDFEATNLQQYLDIQDSYRAEIARVSGVPLHYLFISKGDFPSGEAMKSAEARFTRKIRDKQVSFGTIWEDVVAFCLRIDSLSLADGERLQSVWDSPSPRSERELAETLLMKQALGVSGTQLLKELGYTQDEIAAMEKERDQAQQKQKTLAGNQDGNAMIIPTGSGRMRVPGGDPVRAALTPGG